MPPLPFSPSAEEDSEISEEEEVEEGYVGLGASSVDKRKVGLDVKCGLKAPIANDTVFLCQSSRDVFTSLLDEEINSSDDLRDRKTADNLLLKTPSTTRGAMSQKASCHENQRQDEDEIWKVINQEAESLVLFTKNASQSEKAHKPLRGEGGKLKPNIMLFPQSLGEKRLSHSVHGCGFSSEHEELESDDESTKGLRSTNHIRSRECSVVELLEHVQKEKKQRTVITKKIVKHAKAERRPEIPVMRSAATLGDRIFGREDPSESICSLSSSDDEVQVSEQKVKPGVPETTGKTMTDRIQEVIGTSIVNDPAMYSVTSKPLGLGLYGKLQQVIQTEKQTETKFSRIMQSIEYPYDDSSNFDVNILSRYLEGKLIVCRCAFMRKKLVPDVPKNAESFERTLIFNSRACDDVEIDAGSWIRVYLPWKEVKTVRYGDIILCTYFSQIQYGD